MNRIIFGCFLPAILSILTEVSGASDTYRAAVVEYHPVIVKNDHESTLKANLKNYINYITEASKKKADIIVFPEYGLANSILHPIPDPKDLIIPCNSTTFNTTQTIKDFSCASKNNKIYSVINLLEKRPCDPDDKNCPQKGYYTFNTNVAFDRKGMVVVRYSKYNLYDEKTNKAPKPDIAFFDTDFGVRFGTFVCFDIMFPIPGLKLVQEGVTDYAFSSCWFSETPFLTALQTLRGWSETNNINLLASGVNDPSKGSSGSGIYNGKYGEIVHIMPEFDTSQLLVADVPKFKKGFESYTYEEKRPTIHNEVKTMNDYAFFPPSVSEKMKAESGLALLRDHMHLFESKIIQQDKEKTDETVCSGKDFCCDFHVIKDALTASKNYTIRAVALDGVRTFGKSFRGGVQVCGVLVCDGPEITNCTNRIKDLPGLFKFKEIQIKGNFNAKNSFQMPTTLSHGLKVLSANKYEFLKKEKGSIINVSLELLWPIFDLQVFGIWGRNFVKDGSKI